MILTVKEIVDLAQFAGLSVVVESINVEPDTPITISECPQEGIFINDIERKRYKHIAYSTEYPDEGVYGLGDELEEGKQ